jgi:hypothetical protein
LFLPSRRTARQFRRLCPEIALLEQRSLLSTRYAVGSGVVGGSSSLYEIANYASTPTAIDVGNTSARLTDLAINPQNDAAYAIGFKNL